MKSEQDLLSEAALTVFRLNGQFLNIADGLAEPAGLTATRWQVLGAVLNEALTVSEIARRMGITRQSVQRTTHQLVADGLVQYIANPSHRTAKLVEPTAAGRASVAKINPGHAAFAEMLADSVGVDKLQSLVGQLADLVETLDGLTGIE